MITREALNACGGWATDTVACEEAELHARLNAMGCRIAEIPVPMILHTDAVRFPPSFPCAAWARDRRWPAR